MEVTTGVTAFRYRAARADGSTIRGVERAVSEEAVVAHLMRQGLFVVDVRRSPRAANVARRKVSRQDLAVAFRNVAALTRAGMPVERALGASQTLVKSALGDALEEVRKHIREGREVAQALAARPDVFPSVVVGMVRAGERGSRLADALESVATQLEEESALRSQVRSALSYPLLILVVGVVSLLIMGGVVVPRFAEVLGDLGAELPRSTRILLGVSTLLRRFALPGALLICGALFGSASVLRRPAVRHRVHAALLEIPVIGALRLGFASARTCRALGAMLAAGMPLLSALDASRDAAGDDEVGRRIARARESVSRGERLTPSFERERVLIPVAVQLVGIGESSGDLGKMILSAGDLAAERTGRSLRALISLLEPLLVIGLGLLVALTAGALLQAVYSVRPGVS